MTTSHKHLEKVGRTMNSNDEHNTLPSNRKEFRYKLYYTQKIATGVVKLSHYRNFIASASKAFCECS